MPHIHTDKNQHDLTVTAYIVRTDTPEPMVLLHMHKKLNVLLPVGGHVELNETPWQAIAHELAEESGYDLHQLRILQPRSRIKHLKKVVQHPYPLSMNTHAIPTDHFHTDIQYGFVTNEVPSFVPADGESTDMRWVTEAELKSFSSDMIFDNTRDVYEFLLTEALGQWDAVDPKNFTL